MLDGTVRQAAPPADLFRQPSDPEVAAFLGMRNVLAVAESHTGACLVRGRKIYAGAAGVSTRHIWIKPEEIILSTSPFDSSARNQFECRVTEIERLEPLPAVHVVCGELHLTALITYASLDKMHLADGGRVYATFKSSAVHCF